MALVVDGERGVEKEDHDQEDKKKEGVYGDEVVAPVERGAFEPVSEAESLRKVVHILDCSIVFPFVDELKV